MPNIAIQKIKGEAEKVVPVFDELARRFEDVRRRAFDLFEQRGRELGHAFDDWVKAEHEVMGWPAAELKEIDGKYELDMTLPGFEAKDVEVTAAPGEIVVHAFSKHEKKGTEEHVVWSEFGSNDVYRRFDLPEGIDVDKTEAKLENGMLHILAAKMPKALAKPIPIAA